MQTHSSKSTGYSDGTCPLCPAEIARYRVIDRDGAPCAVDVSEKETDLLNGLTQRQAMKHFPVRAVDGQLLSGAAAFVAVSSRLPTWCSGARGAALPAAVAALERGYRRLLPIRPYISRLFGSVHGRLGRADPGPGR